MHIDSLCSQQRLKPIYLHSEDQRDIGQLNRSCNFPHSALSLSQHKQRCFADEFRPGAESVFRTLHQTPSVAVPSASFQGSTIEGGGWPTVHCSFGAGAVKLARRPLRSEEARAWRGTAGTIQRCLLTAGAEKYPHLYHFSTRVDIGSPRARSTWSRMWQRGRWTWRSRANKKSQRSALAFPLKSLHPGLSALHVWCRLSESNG